MAGVGALCLVAAASTTATTAAPTTLADTSEVDGVYELEPPPDYGNLGETLQHTAVFEVRDGVLTGVHTERYFYPDANNSCTVSIQEFAGSARIEGSTLSGTALHSQTWNGSIAVDLSREECASTSGDLSETINVDGEVSGTTIHVDAFDEDAMIGSDFTLRRVGDLPDGPDDPPGSTSSTSGGSDSSPTTVPADVFTAFSDLGLSDEELDQLDTRLSRYGIPHRDAGTLMTLLGYVDNDEFDGDQDPAVDAAYRSVYIADYLASFTTTDGHPLLPSVAAARPVLAAMMVSATGGDATAGQATAVVRTVRLLLAMDLSRDAPS